MRIITGDEALRTRQDSQFLPKFSKMYESGMTAVTYYKIVYSKELRKRAVVVGAGWGHKVDFSQVNLHKDFIKTNAVIKENKPATLDTLLQFSKIAPCYLEGEKAFKIKMANASGQPAPIIQQQLKNIDEEFDGTDTKPGKNPAVGSLTYLITTECVFVPLDADGKPKISEIRLCTQELSNKKLQEISTAINDRRMVVKEEEGYVELQYAFGNTKNKSQDGQVAPTGTPDGYTLEERYPEDWDIIKGWIDKLPEDSEQIMARNRAFDTVPEEEISSAISAFAAGQNSYLSMLDAGDKKNIGRLKSSASLLKELGIKSDIAEVQEAIDKVGTEAEEETESRTKQLLEEETKRAIEENNEDRGDVLSDENEKKEEKVEEKKDATKEGIEASQGF